MNCKILKVACIVAAMSLAGGCSHKKKKTAEASAPREPEVTDIDIVNAVRDSGVRAAILSQHTLYPYHFEEDGEMLNQLGERDLAVLSSHLLTRKGQINLPRGSSDAALYGARVQKVTEALRAAGVSAENIKIVDGVGGEATPSEEVIRDLRNIRNPQMRQQDAASTPVQTSGATGGQ